MNSQQYRKIGQLLLIGVALTSLGALVVAWASVPAAVAPEEAAAGNPLAQHAEGQHGHGSPHGGVVVTAGDYHLELIAAQSTYQVYLLDEGLNTLPIEGVTGRLIVTGGAEGEVTMVDLAPAGDHLAAVAPGPIPYPGVAVIQLDRGEEPISARIEYELSTTEGSGEGHEGSVRPEGEHDPAHAAWMCPMHPEVVRDESGDCPICRMALVPMAPEGEEEHDHGAHAH